MVDSMILAAEVLHKWLIISMLKFNLKLKYMTCSATNDDDGDDVSYRVALESGININSLPQSQMYVRCWWICYDRMVVAMLRWLGYAVGQLV
jgi:hypothetical protein